MAWNQPDNGNKPGDDRPNNPWGGRPSGGGSKPPSGDDPLQKINDLFKRYLGGNNGGDAGLFKVIAIGAVVLWAITGFYRVEQAERAVVFRFGEFHSVQSAGLHWHPRVMDSIQKVDVENVQQMPLNATMITEDENIVDIALSVQYRVLDAQKYVMQVSNPESALLHATESALRHVVGSAQMTQALTEGRAKIALDMQPRLQAYLDRYNTGIQVGRVNVLEVLPPKQVKSAFDDVVRAKEDRETLKNQAETYAKGIIPEAKGQAARMEAESTAYRQEVIDRAKGDAARFDQLVTEYRKAPGVTRNRLYIETMEEVMGKTSKIVVEGNGNQMLYLPIDKLMQHHNTPAPAPQPAPSSTQQSAPAPVAPAANTRTARGDLR